MKLLALLIAVTLWAIVIYNDNPERSMDVTNIPVELLGQTSLLQNSGLVVSKIENPTVSIKLTGTFSAWHFSMSMIFGFMESMASIT